MKISTGHLNENVLSVKRNLGCFRVNDGRQRKNLALSIIEDWIERLILNNAEELLEFLVTFKFLEQLLSIHGFSLLECLENNILRLSGFVGNWPLNFVVIMSPHGTKGSSSTDVLVQLVLQVDE